MVKKTSKKFRSGLEEAIATELENLNVDYGFEDIDQDSIYLNSSGQIFDPNFVLDIQSVIIQNFGCSNDRIDHNIQFTKFDTNSKDMTPTVQTGESLSKFEMDKTFKLYNNTRNIKLLHLWALNVLNLNQIN